MSWFIRSAIVTILGVAALQAQTTHRAVSSIFASHLASGIARADTITLAPSLRATQPVLQAFLGGQRLSVGTWIEIYGDNLATQAADWSALLGGGQAPISIADTRVTIGGKAAFLWQLIPAAGGKPSQINALVPDGIGTGQMILEVTTPNGTTSTVVTVSQVTPAMLTTPAFNVGGRQYVQAVFGEDLSRPAIYVGRPDLVPGLAFRPAKTGDILTIFAVGCGPTSPAATIGTVASSGLRPAGELNVLFGNVPATKAEAFMSPGSIGLCQLNVTVPPLGNGDVAITTSISSANDGQNLFITIQN